MPSKLSVYKAACLALGERQVQSLSENVPIRAYLDSAWDDDGPQYCLQQGLWNHAMRSIELTYDPSVEPEFSSSSTYSRAFTKPDDFVRTAIVATDGFFRNHLTRYLDEGDYWFCDLDNIYVRYVSDDTQYGMDIAKWKPNFSAYVAHHLAWKVAAVLTGKESDMERLDRASRRMMIKARSTDAMDEATKEIPAGSWISARRNSTRVVDTDR